MTEFISTKITFELSGTREMVNEERAKELLSSVSVLESECTAIKLSNKSFSPEAAAIIMSRVKLCPNIQYADISDVIAGRPEEEALRTLTVFCDSLKSYPLKEVNLSDNALGKKGIHACSDVLVGKAIEKLYLCNNGLSAEACVTVAEILQEGGYPPLTVLHFYNNMSGSNGAIAISNLLPSLVSLQDFRFSATRSDKEGCEAIAKAVGKLDGLRRLDVSDNSFGEEAAKILAASLAKQNKLEYLQLRDAGLTEDGVKAIISSLVKAKIHLTFLDLSGNDITSEAAEDLVELLGSMSSSLQELYLDDNEILNEGVETLIKAIATLENLRVLSLCCCELTASGAYLLSRVVSKIPAFSTLKVDGNQISVRGVEEIKRLMGRAHKILGDLDDNDEDAEDDLEDLLAEDENQSQHNNGNGDDDDKDTEEELVKAMSNVKLEK